MQKDANNPNALHAPSNYYSNPNDYSEKQLKRVDPTVVGSQETHAASYYGIRGGGSKSNISGGKQVANVCMNPNFLFLF